MSARFQSIRSSKKFESETKSMHLIGGYAIVPTRFLELTDLSLDHSTSWQIQIKTF